MESTTESKEDYFGAASEGKGPLDLCGSKAKASEVEQVKNFHAQLATANVALQTERVEMFKHEERNRSNLEKESVSTSEGIASLSRQVHELRVKHKQEMHDTQSQIMEDIMEQISKGKGPVYSKLINQLMGTLQLQMNCGKGELLERVMIPAKSHLEKEATLKRTGSLYRNVKAVIEQEIEQDILMHQGPTFELAEREIRAMVLSEMKEDREKEHARLAAIERDLHLKHADEVQSMVVKLRKEHDELRSALEVHMKDQQTEFSQMYSQEIDNISTEWLKKWTQRENEWLKQLESLQVDEAKEKERFASHIQEHSSEAISKVLLVAQQGTDQAIERIESYLKSLIIKEEEHSQQMASKLEESSDMFTKLVSEVQNSSQDLRNSETEALQQSIESLTNLTAFQRKQQLEFMEKVRHEQEEERAQFKAALAEERERASREKQQTLARAKEENEIILQTIRSQYTTEAEKFRSLEANLMQGVTNLVQKKEEIFVKCTQEANASAQAQWQSILEENLATWRKGEEDRRLALTNELESRYRTIINQLESSVEQALQLKDTADKSWAEECSKVEQKSLDREEKFKMVCQALFLKRMDKFKDEMNEHMKKLELGSLKSAADAAELRCRLESEVLAERARCKVEQQEMIESIYQQHAAHLREVEIRHQSELSKLARSLEASRQKIAMVENLYSKGIHQSMCQNIQSAHELWNIKWEERQDEGRQQAGEKVMSQHRERILELWTVLRLHVTEYTPFLLSLFQTVPYSPQVQSLLEEQVHILSAKVPLMKLASKRELLKHEIKSMQDRSQSSIPKSPERLVERDLLVAKLAMVTKDLDQGLRKFRESFPMEWFLFEGVDYIRVIKEEVKEMPDLVLSPGALKGSDLSDWQFEL